MPGQANNTAGGEKLLAILAHQRSLYQRLDELGRAQSGLVDSDDPNPLLGVLGERQSVVDELVRLDQQIEPLRRDWSGTVASLTMDQRAVAREHLDAMAALASAVAARDESDRRRLSERRGALAEELASIGRGRGAVAAYGPKVRGAPAPKFEDREA